MKGGRLGFDKDWFVPCFMGFVTELPVIVEAVGQISKSSVMPMVAKHQGDRFPNCPRNKQSWRTSL